MQYSELSLYAASVEELNAAIEIAGQHGWEEKRIRASIALAELMRKTWDYDKGLEILKDLSETERYPKLHVQKLGRLAALYHEGSFPDREKQLDTVKLYLNEAIALAVSNGFKPEEAGLKNELGYLFSENGDRQGGLKLLLEAATLFKQHGDTQNYVITMVHVVENYMELGEDEDLIDSVIMHLREMVAGREWYATEIDLFNIIASRKSRQGDSLGRLHWEMEAAKSFVKANNAIHSNQMAAFRVLHDTKKFQEKAEESELLARQSAMELERETARTRELALYLSILGVLILGVIGLLFRERTLKNKVDQANRQLHVANEKYHMLIVESNHRIKNNLQMIISMLEYASKDLPESETGALKRMSGKIYTISALHKHLYLDVHNELVDLDTYFSEIITLYKDISPEILTVEKHIEPIGIKSERIVYFGLIFNEMLANTIEHHRAADRQIHIRVNGENGRFVFEYRDGSVRHDLAKEGTGSALIRQLIRRVGGTNFSFEPSTGQYLFEFHA